MHRFPTIKETMVERAKGKLGSSTDSVLDKMSFTTFVVADNMDNIVPSLPEDIRRIMKDRESSKVTKLRRYFLQYTDRHNPAHPADRICKTLSDLNRYLQNRLIYLGRSRGKDDDSVFCYLYHAEFPQVLLEILHQASFDPDYSRGPIDNHCIPYLAIQLLTCLMHPRSPTFLLLPNKIFVDSKSRLESLEDIACGRSLNWFNRFAVAHFFGCASFSPAGRHWLFTHLDTYRELCSTMAKCGSFVRTQIKHGDVYSKDRFVLAQLNTFREDGLPKNNARIFSHFVTGQCIYAFVHVLQYSHSDYTKFRQVSQAVRAANVLGNFPLVIKQVMSWSDPSHYLLPYLNGISLCLEMEKGFEELLINDINTCLEDSTPVGIHSLEHWTHEKGKKTFPCRLAWFIVHAFLLDNKLGSGWCIHILCWYLERAVDEVAFKIVECCGDELMDLAHIVEWDFPTQTRVQRVILEALLRYGGVGHQDFFGDINEGSLKDVPELKDFCLEAAVFSKKAQCEEKMSLSVKQRRVGESDKLKEEGNSHFKTARYKEAIQSYTEAIAVCPLSARTKQAVYYSNRAECFLRTSEYQKAIHDCNRSLCLDKSLKVKVQWRRARAYKKLGLDYAAWLDMRCMGDEYKLSKEEGGVDFEQTLRLLEDKLNISRDDLRAEIFRHHWYSWCLSGERAP